MTTNHSDLRALQEQAIDELEGDYQSHRLPLELVRFGLQFREHYNYTHAPGGGYIGYPSASQPKVIRKRDGLMLRCDDGTVHFLTLLESLFYRCGILTVQQLNERHRRQPCQA